ncbi:MAG: Lrp/AsnC family transcriptional regulator [Gulosibacter sp.]|uniref:Lrp/AsnC family transcriptional regulator n=1 Tax=Gulosibacter sp. TaxID=2817531 RepID=UPI003F9106A1
MWLDELDHQILAALHVDGRSSWSKIATEIGSSTSTVRRRFESLFERGLIRVIGRTDVSRLGYGPPVIVKYFGRDALRPEFIEHLKHHPHVRFLASTVGSAHALAEIVPRSLSNLQAILTDISQRFDVTSESFVVAHTYTSGQDWLPNAARVIQAKGPSAPVTLTADQTNILSLLLSDGRTSYATLTKALNKSENTVRKAVDEMLTQEIISLRVLVEPQVLGFETIFWVLIDVDPATLVSAATTLAELPSSKTVFATTGSNNLLGQFVLSRHADTYTFMTDVLGKLPGVRDFEILLESDTYKRVWNTLTDGVYTDVAGPDWLFGDSGT